METLDEGIPDNAEIERVPEEALGSLLYTLLDGVALRAFDAISMDDIEAAGGQ